MRDGLLGPRTRSVSPVRMLGPRILPVRGRSSRTGRSLVAIYLFAKVYTSSIIVFFTLKQNDVERSIRSINV